MANLLYTSTSYENTAIAKTVSNEGYAVTAEYDAGQNTVFGPQGGIVTSNSSTIGINIDNTTLAASNFSRVYDGGANPYSTPIAEPEGFFGMLIADADIATLGDISGELSIFNGTENDWLGNGAALTWHTPNQTDDAYTVIVPTDKVVYQTLSARIGGVLVWHVPQNQLGVYGQNMNLPFSTGVTAAMTDTVASELILEAGFGIILKSAGTTQFYNQTW